MPSDEEKADGFYAALDWIGNQAELVTYLLSRYHVVLADRAIQGVYAFLRQHAPWDATQLQLTYLARRRETERRYADADRAVPPDAGNRPGAPRSGPL
jgi:hypothetical protein